MSLIAVTAHNGSVPFTSPILATEESVPGSGVFVVSADTHSQVTGSEGTAFTAPKAEAVFPLRPNGTVGIVVEWVFDPAKTVESWRILENGILYTHQSSAPFIPNTTLGGQAGVTEFVFEVQYAGQPVERFEFTAVGA